MKIKLTRVQTYQFFSAKPSLSEYMREIQAKLFEEIFPEMGLVLGFRK